MLRVGVGHGRGSAETGMRIAFFLRDLRNDGIAIYCLRLAELLPYDCHLVVSRWVTQDVHLRTQIESAFIEVHERPELFRKRSAGMWDIRAFLKRGRFDVLHVHEMSLLALLSLPARTLRIPIVATSHLQAAGSKRWNRLEKHLFSLGLSRLLADVYMAISSEIEADFLGSYRIPTRMVRKVLTGIDLGFFRPPRTSERKASRERYGLGMDDVVFVQLGRLAEVKAPEATIRAVSALIGSTEHRVKLLFAGEGPLRTELERAASTLGVAEHVRFPGFQPARDVLWSADVLCLPSRAEGFPLVVVEAMACGVVPLRSPTGGHRDQTAGVRDLGLMDPDDCELNLQSMHALLDRTRREAVAAECLEIARSRFDRRAMRDAVVELYESLRVG